MLADGVGYEIHEQHYDNEHEGRAVGDGHLCVDVRAACRDDVEVIGQRHALVENAIGQLRQEIRRAGEEDGRRLAGNAA